MNDNAIQIKELEKIYGSGSNKVSALEKINLNSNICDSVWDKGCKGDANAARAGYGIMVLNSYFQRYV